MKKEQLKLPATRHLEFSFLSINASYFNQYFRIAPARARLVLFRQNRNPVRRATAPPGALRKIRRQQKYFQFPSLNYRVNLP